MVLDAAKSTDESRKQWPAFLAILSGVSACAFTMWGAPIYVGEEARHAGLAWLTFAIGGGMAIAAVFLSQRATLGARLLLALGGMVVLLGLSFVAEFNATTLLTRLLPGLGMLLAAPFLDPRPRD